MTRGVHHAPMRALGAGRGLLIATAGLALVAALAACGDDDDDAEAGATSAPATDGTTTTDASDAAGESSTTTTATVPDDSAPDDTTSDTAGELGTTTTTGAWVRPAGCEALPHDPVHVEVDAVPPLAPFALLTDLVVSDELECGDQVVFTFAATPAIGGVAFVPGHDVEEAVGPFTADPSGLPVAVTGDRFVVVRLYPASVVDTTADPPVQTYDGSSGVSPLGGPVVQVEQLGSFEAVTSYVIGLHGEAGFSVETRSDPPRLVITFG
jgi:hypothetical protein